MKILLINHYAGSPEMGMEFRPYYMAREWIRQGHEVDIIAADYSHLRRKNPKVQRDWQIEEIDGICYHWLRTGDYDGNGVRRALTMFRFVGKIWLKAKVIAREWKPDVVITSSTYPLDTYAGQRIRKYCLKDIKLIHEVHDMWPITLIELGHMKKTNPFVILMQIAENSFCKKSDRIVSLLPNADRYFMQHGMPKDHFSVVSNGIVKSEWDHPTPLPKEHTEVFESLKKDGKFIICFFGSHTEAYALTHLIQAVQSINNKKIAVVFVGNGPQKKELEDLALNKPGCNVSFLPPVPKTSIPNLVANTDVLYVGALKNDMFRFGICMNKLFDSMMSERPILYAVAAPNNYIAEYNCGVSVEAENINALRDGILCLYHMNPEQRERLGKNGRKAVLEHFTYEKLAADFAALF